MNVSDISPTNEKDRPHGYWKLYVGDELRCEGNYIDSLKHGYWEWYGLGQLGFNDDTKIYFIWV